MYDFDEKETVLKIKIGHINEFEKIVHRYELKIKSFVLRTVKNEMDADDIVQSTFFKLYLSIANDKFSTEKPLLPYLFQIATNEIKMFYRNSKKTFPLEEAKNNLTSNENQFNLLNFINDLKLKRKEKQIAKMLFEGYSYLDISKKFNKPINTIKTWIRRLRIKIKIDKTYEK